MCHLDNVSYIAAILVSRLKFEMALHIWLAALPLLPRVRRPELTNFPSLAPRPPPPAHRRWWGTSYPSSVLWRGGCMVSRSRCRYVFEYTYVTTCRCTGGGLRGCLHHIIQPANRPKQNAMVAIVGSMKHYCCVAGLRMKQIIVASLVCLFCAR